MTQCPQCGARIKYIPVSYRVDERGTIAVEPEYIEVINDGGRVIKGHLRHRCPEMVMPNATGTVPVCSGIERGE
jgi:hypothetical protein